LDGPGILIHRESPVKYVFVAANLNQTAPEMSNRIGNGPGKQSGDWRVTRFPGRGAVIALKFASHHRRAKRTRGPERKVILDDFPEAGPTGRIHSRNWIMASFKSDVLVDPGKLSPSSLASWFIGPEPTNSIPDRRPIANRKASDLRPFLSFQWVNRNKSAIFGQLSTFCT
jgi:hypothetical protein